MDSLARGDRASGDPARAERQPIRAFRASDAFALEVAKATESWGGGRAAHLGRWLGRLTARGAGAVLAATSAPAGDSLPPSLLERARERMHEAGYLLFLARRLGFLDARRYRSLRILQEAAVREIDALHPTPSPRSRSP